MLRHKIHTQILCSNKSFEDFVIAKYAKDWVITEDQPEATIIIDYPVGSAEQHLRSGVSNQFVLLVGSSAAYSRYISGLGARPIELQLTTPEQLWQIMTENRTANISTPLSWMDVVILHRVALGESNKLIARHLECTEVIIKNTLHKIFKAIGVKNRVQATLYYFGLHQEMRMI
ncbi:LuxR C-terminal-related transcriptional regulator [Deinococcus soli (ex Cha et al. 2016)]|uniref:DNA-binding NarL/FixJ family response regulator n=2 Tax=Deinococcus soli (ex Cha et al. 2016) TaxID=1309411 RepID=A0ACC6KQ56_9DEIO|nr:LuxR C-terminal-related transcriptional regulator [Deinococcus soli (ex Cha et al. 2016)]MDR6221444.1 DNA-binding NarL/FixJ family response regulator [Deinococcus soli (ex Cha et al. 2016)]MDR6331427.1 DNA-binding NarL/FixJ family response regulator [Deinococcus soli (ex Cha et al. 2016)]MDR6754586.1 DNA-binding NarL/FixJ family response regulator [Deinococcus soli (ex Cha et al. 2016)]